MNIGFKRIAAYIIDIILVGILVFILSNTKVINFQIDKYNKTYTEYSKLYDKQNKLKTKYEKLKDDKKASKEKISSAKLKYNEALKIYEKSSKKYTYKLAKYSVFSTSISIGLTLIYFGVIQYLLKGQTLGKKLLKIKVVKNKEGRLNIFNFLLRSFILNSLWAKLILVISVNFLTVNSYYTLNYYVTNVLYIVELVILVMVFMNKDARGLHDVIASTKVVSIKE